MSPVRRRWIALLALLSVAVSLGMGFGDRLFCRMMGRTVSACCCGKDGARATAASSAELTRPNCCERVERHSAAVPGVREGDARLPAPPLATAAAWFVLTAHGNPAERVAHSVQARAPPHSGPPLFLKHCALLS